MKTKMKIKWYFFNIISDFAIMFVLTLIIRIIICFIADKQPFNSVLIWCVMVSIIKVIVDVFILGLVERKINQYEKDNIMNALSKLNYKKIDYSDSSCFIYYKCKNISFLYADVIICDNDDSSFVYMSRCIKNKIENILYMN